jgi:hypothetical protein
MHGMESENEILSKILNPQRLPLPSEPPIVELRWEPYVDHLGDSELHVWAILDESATSEQRRGHQISAASHVIREALQAAGIKKFPYLRFLKRSEIEEMGIHV